MGKRGYEVREQGDGGLGNKTTIDNKVREQVREQPRGQAFTLLLLSLIHI